VFDDLQFIRPQWLSAIPVVIAAAIYLARRSLSAGGWSQVIDPELLPHVLSDANEKGSRHPWWLFGLVGVIACVALAGPAFERLEQPVFRSDQAMVVALDMSRSMDAQDIAPSRLVRARLKILDLLERRATGQTALVVYSSNAFTVTPLTNDTDTISALVNSLGTDIMPSRGSYPVAAIEKGKQLLDQAGVGYGEVLLVADGGASPAATSFARELRESGYTLSVLGVGTTDGAPIPKANGGFVTDRSGNLAIPRLEEDGLRALAEAGGGRYSRLTSDNSDLDYLLSGEVLAQQSASEGNLATDQWREDGPWLILVLLPLAALAFRRGWVMLLLVFVMPLPVHASIWNDLWQTKDQQAREALENGDPETAAQLFQDPDWKAVADYRNTDFAKSADQFAAGDDARSLYNLGNALAKQGQFESALEAYSAALEKNPEDEDAVYNRDLVKQLMEQQQQQQDEQESEEGEGQGDQSESENSEQSEQGQDDDGESDSSSSEGEGRESEEQQSDMEAMEEELRKAAEQQAREQQNMSEAELAELRKQQEQDQAMEQWLRRIPNDPGGLLRRKFRYQYQRMGIDQDGNNLWPDDEVQPW
jgi:Ca-activated chloride channel family protein